MYLLLNPPPNVINFPSESSRKKTTSTKSWAEEFRPIYQYQSHRPTMNYFDTIFGPLTTDDSTRIATPTSFPSKIEQYILFEQDVRRAFDVNISNDVEHGWVDKFPVIRMSESGPFGNSRFSGSVDALYAKNYNKKTFALAIGEFKAPGIITEGWFKSNNALSTGMQKLGQELRGYAYHYSCPQVFCYDAVNLLIVRFRAVSREDIKGCDADVFFLPNSTPEDGVFMRYALYRLISDGLNRVVASNGYNVTYGPYTRRFDWFNGNPYWESGPHRYEFPGVFLERKIVGNQWGWFNGDSWVAWCTDAF